MDDNISPVISQAQDDALEGINLNETVRDLVDEIKQNRADEAKQRLITPQTSLTKAYRLFNEKFGWEWIGFDPMTIVLEMGLIPTQLMTDKIQTLQLLKTFPESYYTGLMEFINLSGVINNDELDPEIYSYLSPLELAYSCYVSDCICDPEDTSTEFSFDIREYITRSLEEENFPGDLMPFSDIILSPMNTENAQQEYINKKTAISLYIAYMESQ